MATIAQMILQKERHAKTAPALYAEAKRIEIALKAARVKRAQERKNHAA